MKKEEATHNSLEKMPILATRWIEMIPALGPYERGTIPIGDK